MRSLIINYANWRCDFAFGIPTCEPYIDFHSRFRSEIVRDDFMSKSARLFN